MVAAPAKQETGAPAQPAFMDYGPGTFVPHACFAWMPRLTDTELRLLLVVIRQTLGWHDPATGARKQSDWLSLRRLAALTGRGHAALSVALDGLVRTELVEVRGTGGEALDTPQGRRAARRLWLAPGPGLRSAEGERVKDGPTDDLASLARDVFGADGAENGLDHQGSGFIRSVGVTPSEESTLGRRTDAPLSAESGVQKVDTTKETQYKIILTKAVRKQDTGGPGQPRRPTPPATTPAVAFSPATQGMMARFARFEHESAGNSWRWDKAARKWVKIERESGDLPA